MFEYLYGLVMGLVQGLTEFLPVSSSGHLVLLKTLFRFEDSGGILFEVVLHLGTLVSIVIYYRKDILNMIREFFKILGRVFRGKMPEKNEDSRMILFIIISVLPLFIMVPLKDKIESLFSQPVVVGFALMATAVLLFVADRFKKGKKTVMTAKGTDALVVGLSQCIALVPGLSRSGTTISTGIFRGFDRAFAVRFSFLMSLPAVLGSAVLSIKDVVELGVDTGMLGPAAVGFVAAMFSGLVAIRLVSYLVKKDKFGGFAYYCAAVGLVVVIMNLIV